MRRPQCGRLCSDLNRNSFSRAAQPNLHFKSCLLQLHYIVYLCTSILTHCSVLIIFDIFPDFPPLRRGANRSTRSNMYTCIVLSVLSYMYYRLYYCICTVYSYLLLTYVLYIRMHCWLAAPTYSNYCAIA